MTIQFLMTKTSLRLYPGNSWNGLGGTWKTLGRARPLSDGLPASLVLYLLQNSSMETSMFFSDVTGRDFTFVHLLLILQNLIAEVLTRYGMP